MRDLGGYRTYRERLLPLGFKQVAETTFLQARDRCMYKALPFGHKLSR